MLLRVPQRRVLCLLYRTLSCSCPLAPSCHYKYRDGLPLPRPVPTTM